MPSPGDFACDAGRGQIERVAYRDFAGVKPFYGQILDLQRFEFGVVNHHATNRQPSDRQRADCECAHSDGADRSSNHRHDAEAEAL